jgi:hypothetical protein
MADAPPPAAEAHNGTIGGPAAMPHQAPPAQGSNGTAATNGSGNGSGAYASLQWMAPNSDPGLPRDAGEARGIPVHGATGFVAFEVPGGQKE